jgi:hypothetical protein
MPARTERYRFVPWEIQDVNGVPRRLPGGYADVTRGGGMKYERVVFQGLGTRCATSSTSREAMSGSWSNSALLRELLGRIPSKRRGARFLAGVTADRTGRVCPTDTRWWDSRIQGLPVPCGAVWSFETATAQGLKPNRTTSRAAGKRRCRHWLEPRLSLDHCKPAAHTRIG